MILTPSKSKENATNTEKEIQTKAFNYVQETSGHKGNSGTKPVDLHSMSVALPSENPKGMSLKVCNSNSYKIFENHKYIMLFFPSSICWSNTK